MVLTSQYTVKLIHRFFKSVSVYFTNQINMVMPHLDDYYQDHLVVLLHHQLDLVKLLMAQLILITETLMKTNLIMQDVQRIFE
ncbi:hypothetical protein CKA49_37665 [Pseudomonas aeruginosa]|nr:hypothetical protein CKA49_37665 [Pseudomonas aeruginosa]